MKMPIIITNTGKKLRTKFFVPDFRSSEGVTSLLAVWPLFHSHTRNSTASNICQVKKRIREESKG